MEEKGSWHFLGTVYNKIFIIYIPLLFKLPANENLKFLTCSYPHNYTPFF